MNAHPPIPADLVIHMHFDALRALFRQVEAAMAEGADACQLTLQTESGEEVQFVVGAP